MRPPTPRLSLLRWLLLTGWRRAVVREAVTGEDQIVYRIHLPYYRRGPWRARVSISWRLDGPVWAITGVEPPRDAKTARANEEK